MKAPVLLQTLSGGVSSGPAICTCASILLKFHNPKVNLVQAMVSAVLKRSRSGLPHDHLHRTS